ncbi:hypothetical protein GCM10008023_12900 [Sphingomonas glacialis]|uniref:Uncharacterized protein n=1 Tax=Sphingomonas glacialis TaxID=658225 RepID=A0ABQ3LH16_9SPHN|nr:hypothetical protein GCM10008023_12900 [Sphingomonas glacialis]
MCRADVFAHIPHRRGRFRAPRKWAWRSGGARGGGLFGSLWGKRETTPSCPPVQRGGGDTLWG